MFAFADIVSGRCFETDRVQQFVQVIDDALIEPIELRTLRIWQRRVSPKRLEQACRQGLPHGRVGLTCGVVNPGTVKWARVQAVVLHL